MANSIKPRSKVGFSHRKIYTFDTEKKLKDTIMKYQTNAHLQLFDLQENEILGIYGPAGSGKSTLLRLFDLSVTNLASEDVQNRDQPDEQKKAQGQIDGNSSLVNDSESGLTTLDTLIQALGPNDISSYEGRGRLKRALRYLSMEGDIYKQPLCHSSRAMRLKATILRAYLKSPAYILLDEPTVGATEQCQRKIHEMLRELKSYGRTAVVITTKDSSEAELLCDRVILVNQGLVIAYGETGALVNTISLNPSEEVSLAALYHQLNERIPHVN
jgi:ABC-type multidrug transport system ATPase subunit